MIVKSATTRELFDGIESFGVTINEIIDPDDLSHDVSREFFQWVTACQAEARKRVYDDIDTLKNRTYSNEQYTILFLGVNNVI